MANFIGHLVPGILFTLLGSWWMHNVWTKYFLAMKDSPVSGTARRRVKYTSSASFPCPCFPRVHLEGIFKATITPLGMLAEIITGLHKDGYIKYQNLQHLTMYFFFGLNGVVDIMTFYKCPIPNGSDYAAAALGFSMEALLFFFHLHGRYEVDVQVHRLLLYVVFWCVALTVAEAIRRHSVMTALARCYFIILQGTWLIQIALLLYWPFGTQWRTDDHYDVMAVTVIFCWHSAGIFVVIALVGLFTSWRMRHLPSSSSTYFTLNSLDKSYDAKLESHTAQEITKMIEDSEDEVI